MEIINEDGRREKLTDDCGKRFLVGDVYEKSGVADENEFKNIKYKSFFLVGLGSYSTFNIEKFTGHATGFSLKSMHISLGYARITSSSLKTLILFRFCVETLYKLNVKSKKFSVYVSKYFHKTDVNDLIQSFLTGITAKLTSHIKYCFDNLKTFLKAKEKLHLNGSLMTFYCPILQVRAQKSRLEAKLTIQERFSCLLV